MSIIWSENFDGVTAPAQPANWTTDGNAVTSTVSPRSGLNSYVAATAVSYNYYNAAQDGNGGDCQCEVYFLPVANFAGPLIRVTPPIAAGAGSGYLAVISGTNIARLYKRVAGVTTQLGATVTASPAFTATDYHRVRVRASGTTISGFCQRLNGDWLTSAGGWNSTEQAYLSLTDASISGQGYGGLQLNGGAVAIRVDDWLFESLANPVSGFRTLLGVGI